MSSSNTNLTPGSNLDAWLDLPSAGGRSNDGQNRASSSGYPSPALSQMNINSPSVFQKETGRASNTTTPSQASRVSQSPGGAYSAFQNPQSAQNVMLPFNPNLYDVSNIPPSSDPLFGYAGYTAGMMASQSNHQNFNLVSPGFLQPTYVTPAQQQFQSRSDPTSSRQHGTDSRTAALTEPEQRDSQAVSTPSNAPSMPNRLPPTPAMSFFPTTGLTPGSADITQHVLGGGYGPGAMNLGGTFSSFPSSTSTRAPQNRANTETSAISKSPTNETENKGVSYVSGLTGIPDNISIAPQTANNLSGLYSTTGFDIIGILARVVSRPNPQINIGPIDMSCSFLVVDARKYDFPIVYCSPTFESLTGYSASEIVNRNCRFLQSPDGTVALGSCRKYTDNAAVYHMKMHMLQGKECQASVINYRKGGQPFINLVTVIPIAWDSDEIAYFIGLQVDLVEQPNAILEKMKYGTYAVNYQMMNIPPYIPGDFVTEPVDDYFRDIPTATPFPATPEVFDLIGSNNDHESSRRLWNRMLLDQSDSFVHVLSLKGIFLYCSAASRKLLEYEPDELIGRSLSAICHPSDIVPVMRELKEASTGNDNVNLVYRIRRKNSGYMWIECQGKLHLEQGKGRKCVILSGRERPVYRLVMMDVMDATLTGSESTDNNGSPNGEAMDGVDGRAAFDETFPFTAEAEFWSKISNDGLLLYATSSATEILGFPIKDIVGASLYQMVRNDRTTDVTRALTQAKEGRTINLRHHMQTDSGEYIKVFSTFYPGDTSHGVGRPSF
ncbi:hypothetical protein BZG36_03618, partial [Bifiguratus adelaidae]